MAAPGRGRAAGRRRSPTSPAIVAARRAEADEFYAAITPDAVERRRGERDAPGAGRDAVVEAVVLLRPRRLVAGAPTPTRCASPERLGTRNAAWFHMLNHDVISMPDTWEYPWYAAWDLAFHCLPLAMVDPDFATSQLDLMLSQVYLHPSGQIPAYEWNFGDVNPPVHAFATLFMHSVAGHMGAVDLPFLRQSFTRLLLNFTWWVNRKDPTGKNVFEGGFLGLDNIGVFDRSAPLPERRPARAGRRHGVDGAVQPEHARAGDRAARGRSRLRRLRAQVRRALLLDRRGHRPGRQPPRRDVGRGGRLLLRRAAPPRRHRRAAEGALARRPAAAVRHARSIVGRGVRAPPRAAARASARFLDRNRDLLANVADPFEPGVQRPPPAVARQRGQAAPDPRPDARRGALPRPARHPLDLADPPRPSPTRSSSTASPTASQYEPAESTTGMFGGNSNWRGPGVVPRQRADHPGPAAALPLLRRRLHDRVPDRVRATR